MTDEFNQLLVENLQAIHADIATIKGDLIEVKSRLGTLSVGLAALRPDIGDPPQQGSEPVYQ